MINALYRLKHPTGGDELLTYNLTEVSNAYFTYGFKIDGVYGRVAKSSNINLVPVYKLRHPNSGDRLFTANLAERNSAINTHGYQYEGAGFYASLTNLDNNLIPVYRLLKYDKHRYTFGELEKTQAINSGWILELEGKPAFYCRPSKLY